MKISTAAFLLCCAVGLGLSGALSGCADNTSAATANVRAAPTAESLSGAPRRVDVTTFAALVRTPGVAVVDVRTPQEFASGHLPGAVNIPVQSTDFAQRVADLDPAATYAVYCRSGNRSQPAVAQMRAAGITTVYELETGTNGWTAAGQPLVR